MLYVKLCNSIYMTALCGDQFIKPLGITNDFTRSAGHSPASVGRFTLREWYSLLTEIWQGYWFNHRTSMNLESRDIYDWIQRTWKYEYHPKSVLTNPHEYAPRCCIPEQLDLYQLNLLFKLTCRFGCYRHTHKPHPCMYCTGLCVNMYLHIYVGLNYIYKYLV